MSLTITGSASAVTPASPVTSKAPADGDALNANSVEDNSTTPKTGFQASANWDEWARQEIRGDLTVVKALFDGTGNATPPSWNGVAPYIGTSGNCAAAAPLVALGFRDTTAGAAQVRFIRTAAGGLWIVRNAYWDTTGSLWTQDDIAVDSTAIYMPSTAAAAVYVYRMAAGTAAWGLNGWDYGSLIAKSVTAATFLEATTSILAGTTIATTSGSVTAGGAVSGNTGPGLLKGKRLYSTGTAVAGTDIVADAAWGVGTTLAVVSGSTDMAGSVTVTCGGGGGLAVNPTVTLTFKDGTFTTAPKVIWALTQGTGAPAFVYTNSLSATATSVVYIALPAIGLTYTFNWIAIGS